jgi:hypothetical protein
MDMLFASHRLGLKVHESRVRVKRFKLARACRGGDCQADTETCYRAGVSHW